MLLADECSLYATSNRDNMVGLSQLLQIVFLFVLKCENTLKVSIDSRPSYFSGVPVMWLQGMARHCMDLAENESQNDPLASPLVPPTGRRLCLSSETVKHLAEVLARQALVVSSVCPNVFGAPRLFLQAYSRFWWFLVVRIYNNCMECCEIIDIDVPLRIIANNLGSPNFYYCYYHVKIQFALIWGY